MLWSSSISTFANAQDAIRDAVAAAVRGLNGAAPDAAFLFVSGYPPHEIENAGREVAAATGARQLLGCTAGGVLAAGKEVEQRAAVSLTLASLPGVDVRPFYIQAEQYPDGDAAPTEWRKILGVDAAGERGAAPSFIIIPDPWSADPEALIAGLDYAYPKSVKIGGLASGARRRGGNYLYLNQAAHRSGTIGLALSGAISVETAVAQGCRPIGAVGRATRSSGNYLIEIEGQKAVDFVHQQVESITDEERALANRSLFIGVAMDPLSERPPEQGDFLIRNFLGVDAEKGVFAVNEEIGVGRAIQLHVRDAKTSRDDLVAVLRRSMRRAKNARPEGALLFSCLGRGRNLYGEADKDSQLFLSVAGSEVPLGGFFCNGEIGPISGETYLHGFTSSFGLFRTPPR